MYNVIYMQENKYTRFMRQVKAPLVDKFYFYGSDTYVIPWKDQGMAVLGGWMHFGSYDEQANERNTEEIPERCIELLPSLKEPLETKDYEVWVGLRPYRNQIRVEIENVDDTLVSFSNRRKLYLIRVRKRIATFAQKQTLNTHTTDSESTA